MILKDNAPKQQFVKTDESAHWYEYKGGVVLPRYEATLREARKQNLFPSPTSIEKDVRANPMLARWIRNETVKAFINNPRTPGEDDDAYAQRCLAVSDNIAKEAAERGTNIHDAIEHNGTLLQDIVPFFEAYVPWHNEFVQETEACEASLVDLGIGVAGRVDRVAIVKGVGRTIIDYKTQRVKAKASFYESFPRQLSFYAKAYQNMYGGDLPRIMSVVIDSQTPSRPVEKLYSVEEQEQAHKEFMCHAWLWFSSKNFWPVGRWDVSFGR
jgi:hypothetical protein